MILSTQLSEPPRPNSFSDTTCSNCGLSNHCPTNAIRLTDLRLQHPRSMKQRRYAKETALFVQGEPAQRILTLKSGALKAVNVDQAGIETVTGFYFPGDLIGIQSVQFDRYPVTLLALEPSVTCEIRPSDFVRHLNDSSRLLRQLVETLLEQQRAAMIQYQFVTHASAEARIAHFLLQMVARMARVSRRTDYLRLPMSRTDMSSFLGLAPETTSRSLRHFERMGVIGVRGKEIRIDDHRALSEAAHLQ